MQGSAARATSRTTISIRSVGGAVTAYCGASAKTTPQTSLGTRRKPPQPGAGTISLNNRERRTMPGTETIRRAVQSVRNRVQRDNGYINSESRTKYVLIDPLLRALGWDTADLARVKMEFRCPNA